MWCGAAPAATPVGPPSGDTPSPRRGGGGRGSAIQFAQSPSAARLPLQNARPSRRATVWAGSTRPTRRDGDWSVSAAALQVVPGIGSYPDPDLQHVQWRCQMWCGAAPAATPVGPPSGDTPSPRRGGGGQGSAIQFAQSPSAARLKRPCKTRGLRVEQRFGQAAPGPPGGTATGAIRPDARREVRDHATRPGQQRHDERDCRGLQTAGRISHIARIWRSASPLHQRLQRFPTSCTP